MTQRLKKNVGIMIALIVILGAASVAVVFRFFHAMNSARFDAADPRLPEIAKTAVPVAAAVKKYFDVNGAYPANLPAVKAYLPADCQLSSGGYVNGWEYAPAPGGGGFSLWRRLSHDPSIEYQWNGSADSWMFHPGDGGADKMIVPAP